MHFSNSFEHDQRTENVQDVYEYAHGHKKKLRILNEFHQITEKFCTLHEHDGGADGVLVDIVLMTKKSMKQKNDKNLHTKKKHHWYQVIQTNDLQALNLI